MNKFMLATQTVALLMTDVVGSTRLEQQFGPKFLGWLQDHVDVAVTLAQESGGKVLKHRGEGDSLFAAFPTPQQAVEAACAWQRAFRQIPTFGVPVEVRMAVDFGEAYALESDFWGGLVNRCARLREIAHGGQILVSGPAASAAQFRRLDLGAQQLRDVELPLEVVQVVAEGLSQDFPPLKNPLHLAQLPSYGTTFHGRDAERSELKRLVASHRLVSCLGPGGSGKSRLGVEVASRSGSQFKGGIVHIDLLAADSVETLVQAIANRLDATSAATTLAQLGERLNQVAALLILDNADHAIEITRELVANLLRATRLPHFLVTSREALGSPEERRFVLGSLAQDAPNLLMERAIACGSMISLTDSAIISQLAASVDELPLGLELLAPMLAVMSPREVLALVQEYSPLDLEGTGEAHRHRSLDGMVAWSVERLQPEDRARLTMLGMFVGSFPLSAASAVWGETPWQGAQNLKRLVERSLVQYDPHAGESGQYRLLQTTAAYVRRTEPDRDAISRFVQEVARVARDLDLALRKTQSPQNFRNWDDWRQSVNRAIQLAACPELAEVGMRIVHHASLYWGWRAGSNDHYAMAEKLNAFVPDEASLARAEFYNSLAVMSLRTGRIPEALDAALKSLSDARAVNAPLHEAKTLLNLSLLHLQAGEVDEAIQVSRQASELFRKLDDRDNLAANLTNLGAMLNRPGSFDEAASVLHEAIELFRQLGNRGRLVLALHNLAENQIKNQQPAAALEAILESAELAKEMNLPGSMSQAAQLGALALRHAGHEKEAAVVWASRQSGEGETIVRHSALEDAFPADFDWFRQSSAAAVDDWTDLLKKIQSASKIAE